MKTWWSLIVVVLAALSFGAGLAACDDSGDSACADAAHELIACAHGYCEDGGEGVGGPVCSCADDESLNTDTCQCKPDPATIDDLIAQCESTGVMASCEAVVAALAAKDDICW